jgi:hypothetical protein
MSTYLVSSGGIENYRVKAKTRKLAAFKAIDENENVTLGALIMVEKEGEHVDKNVYFSTTTLLEEMGYVVDSENE